MVKIQFSQEVHLWSPRTPHWVSFDPTCNQISDYLCVCSALKQENQEKNENQRNIKGKV